METAVSYGRFSSDKQTEQSIEGQLRACEEFAKSRGIKIIGTYIDRGLSGKVDSRPEFQRMIKDSSKGLFKYVLVYQLDRFSRNKYDSAIHKNTLRKNGVKVLSAKENISDDPSGILMETMLEGMAEYYVAELAVKVKRGMKESWLKGHYLGGLIAYGYDKVSLDPERPKTKKYEINKHESEVVCEIFKRYASGETIKSIQKWLDGKKILNKKGQPFVKNTLLSMLSNKKYIGTLTYAGQENPNSIPTIVEEKTFNDVQKRLSKNKRQSSKGKAVECYLLTGKMLCGYCHKAVTADSGTSGTNGLIYRYYKCVTKKNLSKPCECKAVPKNMLENLVIDATMKNVLTDEQIAYIVKSLMEKNKELERNFHLERFEKELKITQTKINSLVDMACNGLATKSTQEKLLELENEKADLEGRIESEKLNTPLPMDADELTYWLESFRDIDADDEKSRQMLIDMFINKIVLLNDKVIITFNVKGRDNSQLTVEEILKDVETKTNSFANEKVRNSTIWSSLSDSN